MDILACGLDIGRGFMIFVIFVLLIGISLEKSNLFMNVCIDRFYLKSTRTLDNLENLSGLSLNI